MKTSFSRLLLLPCISVLLAWPALIPAGRAQIVTNWVAFNDHRPGPTPPAPGEWGTALGVTTYDMGVSGGTGNLTNLLTGDQLPVTMTVTPNGSPDDFGTAFPPDPGTPAYDLFFGICDISNDGIVGVRYSSDTYVTFTFSNLDPEKRYLFRGTAIRGGSYLLRWAAANIFDVDGALDAHTSGVLTSNDFPNAILPGQAAFNSGENRVGDLIGWDFINPGADGSFSIICSNYVGPIPGNQMADNTRYGYSFGALLLAEVEATPPVITEQPPTEVTVTQNRPFSLSVTATGTPLFYQWYKEGVGAIEGATFPTYSVSQAALGDAGDYYVVIENPVQNATSTVSRVIVNADLAPPALTSVFAYPEVDPLTQAATLNQITLEFDEPVEPATATPVTSYLVPGGGNPVSVTLTNDRTVLLELAAPLTEDTDYTVTVSGISDTLGNTAASLDGPFHTWVSGPGNGLLFEAYNIGAGVETALLTNNPAFPNQPDLRTNLYAFDSRVIYPDDTVEDYGSRTRGVFIPPISGDWVFFLRTYDRGEVRFNPDGLDAAGARPILAEVTGNEPRDWDKFISAPFRLRGGQAYYIEGLQKAGTGTDVIKVAARLAGTGLPTLGVDNLEIDPSSLSGAAIGTPLAPRDLGGALTITEDLADPIAEEFHPITLSITVDNPSGLPVIYQWFRDGSPLEGATGPSYRFQPVLSDHNATFSVQAAKLGSTVSSRAASLTVVEDTTPPQADRVISDASNLSVIQLVFNELMSPAQLDDNFIYALPPTSVTLAVPEADGLTVTLMLAAPLTLGETYQLLVFGGSDLAGNAIDPGDPSIVNFVAGGDSPGLTIQRDDSNVILSWPVSEETFVLEETTALVLPPDTIVWTPVGITPEMVAGSNTVTVAIGTGTRVFRLRQQ